LPVTIRDLAEKLKLSITTVSRALDGYADVSEETRKRVILTAEEMGYEPSFAARQLRRKRADTIGYILPTSSPQFSDPFFVNFLTGLCDEAALLHLDLTVTSCPPDSEKEHSQYRRWVQGNRVDGIVINRLRTTDWRITFLLENQIPFVCLGQAENGDSFPSVAVDERNGIARLVAHLVEKGHRRIAFIGASPQLVLQRERFAGYESGLRAASIALMPELISHGDLSEDSGYRVTVELLALPDPPTAILACNDRMALGALRAAQEQGISVGPQLAIAGYDGIKETEYTNPAITTLHQPTYEIARILAGMLGKLIQGQPLENPHQTIQPELVIRPSTG